MGSPINPLLGPLLPNGGQTPTRALLPGSPAIDAGNPGGCRDEMATLLLTDQTGFTRTFDGDGDSTAICDIGAYQYRPQPSRAAPALGEFGLLMLAASLLALGLRRLA